MKSLYVLGSHADNMHDMARKGRVDQKGVDQFDEQWVCELCGGLATVGVFDCNVHCTGMGDAYVCTGCIIDAGHEVPYDNGDGGRHWHYRRSRLVTEKLKTKRAAG